MESRNIEIFRVRFYIFNHKKIHNFDFANVSLYVQRQYISKHRKTKIGMIAWLETQKNVAQWSKCDENASFEKTAVKFCNVDIMYIKGLLIPAVVLFDGKWFMTVFSCFPTRLVYTIPHSCPFAQPSRAVTVLDAVTSEG